MKSSSLEILEKAQLPPEHARAIFKVMELEIEHRDEILATKDDLHVLKGDIHVLKGDIHALELRIGALEVKMERLGSKLVAWVFSTFLATVVILSAELHFALGRLTR